MGNTGSGKRDRAYSSDTECAPTSPSRDEKNYETGKKNKIIYQPSVDDVEDFPGSPKEVDLSTSTNTLPIGVNQSETTLPTVFKWELGGKEVYLSGTFSNWEPIKMIHSHGDCVLILDLAEGEHQYKFLVDGQWHHNPNEPICDNGMGSKNNVVRVRKEDFEVFEALAMDSVNTSSGSQTDITGSPLGEYSQESPQRRPHNKTPGPPVLPPHLLQVILNKDIPISCEPTLLPEPNHVMLNHLYALSIKDGVLVLSTTQRYRKKYVTTVFYKPI
ncbi:5'-AMP-activated protein kinase subunit beta-2-like [Limulus polyphemus]|uniref:5'-AMP-activated protein kinase subunit beta-1 n=1 Tax=Limulus polyphemus TaxID=6850 RepID=A0ABM1BDW4_LIMPO|nr:5'-AMP-activated protein kinase subunit beta-2-like [Limulus polyphemus]XP_013780015.1 5'-AMP-activated protein kinase subunit beta-2-like [Limulus polyphemus]